ncbi:VOC family protein [Phenylobacterium sp.]|uniref:VOC family protein n=1 Tax=Phenylobacterium sp. TaxID=1871053 RepID=UPI00286B9FB6|nr:VOC family protein [Phenylobacterium sp.]
MQITASVVCLNVDNVAASSAFLQRHFGFRQEMAADGFVSLAREDVGMNVVFHRRGLEILPEPFRDQHLSGVAIAFTVADLGAEEARLRAEGLTFTLPLTEQPWGERLFQVTDPNGLVVELMEWSAPQPG